MNDAVISASTDGQLECASAFGTSSYSLCRSSSAFGDVTRFDDVTNADIVRPCGARDITGTHGICDITWVLGPIVPKVIFTWGPVDLEVVLSTTIAYPIETHVYNGSAASCGECSGQCRAEC
eukprot:15356919-Ditylum_brightwellii.AAC.1